MRKTLIIMTLLILLFSLACKKSDKDSIDITLDWTPNTNHTGLYVAQELGYFEQAGLKVKIQQPGQNITDQIVASGKSEFGVSYQENVIRARSEDIPLVSVAAVIQNNTSGFASLKKAGITSVKDFEGKRYGSWDSPSEIAILRYLMEREGADFEKVEIVSGIYDFFSTIGKDADFEWIFYGWDGVSAEDMGIELNYIPLNGLDPVLNYYTPVIISSEKYLAENPEVAKRFLQAVKKGYEYTIKYPAQAAEILLKHVPELDQGKVLQSLSYLSNEFRGEAPYWGYQANDVWYNFTNWMYDEGLLDSAIEIEQAFSNGFLID